MTNNEPRWWTISDLFLASLGVAVFVCLPHARGGTVFSSPVWLVVSLYCLLAALVGVFTSVFIVVGRVYKYRRWPFPWEWLAIVATAIWIAQLLHTPDEVINRVFGSDTQLTFSAKRWFVACASTLVSIPMFTFAFITRRERSRWLAVLIALGAGVVLQWGVVDVMKLEAIDPIVSLFNFQVDSWRFWWLRSAVEVIVFLPVTMSLVALATLGLRRFSLKRSEMVFTEWLVGLLASVGCLNWSLLFYFFSYETPHQGWITNRVVTTLVIMLIAAGTWRFTRRSTAVASSS